MASIEKNNVELNAWKSPEGNDTYYCDLDTGYRLVIRSGELAGVYNPGAKED